MSSNPIQARCGSSVPHGAHRVSNAVRTSGPLGVYTGGICLGNVGPAIVEVVRPPKGSRARRLAITVERARIRTRRRFRLMLNNGRTAEHRNLYAESVGLLTRLVIEERDQV